MKIRHILPLIIVLPLTIVATARGGEARAQANAGPAPPPRTMASLLAEGYEMQDVRVFKDKIWLRKPGGEDTAFICDRGRIGSAAFDAYRARNYNEIQCSLAK